MSDVAAWLEAIGTITVATVAVFHDLLYTWITRPKLDVSIRPDPPDCMMLRWGQQESVESGIQVSTKPIYYLRIRVENTGKRKAESVQIRVTKVMKKQLDGKYAISEEFPPMNLHWANSHQVFLPTIHPNTYEHCDLAHILRPSDRGMLFEQRTWDGVDPNKTILSVDTADKSYSLPHLLPPGSHRLHITISSADTKPLQKIVEVDLSGQWYDDEKTMRSQGVAVRLLEESPKP